ncbi:MAG: putative metal-binding motif-containing protein [Myxococcales bacterium]|nr:putative metal-binding motif-containing protein [Myxococcales bacterium]MCB9520144.1 putative metal-binding motif-containing protein [Myxococcales bacterium]MCB9534311.1 putative metal-binding motif-containing protein [Myxococcales bacterium]
MAALVSGCGDSPPGGGDDAGGRPDIRPIDDAAAEIAPADVAPLDVGEVDDDAEPDTSDGSCEISDDCPASELCVDLVPGEGGGFCAEACGTDMPCPDGLDCVTITDGETAYSVCLDPDFCVDADGDGFGVGPGCRGADCDDDNDTISPGATETCNGTDDDCDGRVDDNPIEEGDDCATGFPGVCAEGRLTCRAGLIDCVPRVPASAELCDDDDNDCDGDVDEEATDARTWFRDLDEDRYGDAGDAVTACSAPAGYVADGDDCDDGARGTNPGAAEVCDGADNDCNGEIDDGAGGMSLWYLDFDGDGWGTGDDSVIACNPIPGRVARAGDCDDRAFAVNPAVEERCNGYDDNCAGGIDEMGAIDAPTWYRDFDGDTYGDAAASTRACAQPEGYVSNDLDCADGEFGRHPGVPEICDGTDQDCDRVADEGVSTTYYRDADGDTFGNADVTIQACALPDGYRTNAGDCDDTTELRRPGLAETCDELDNDCNGVADDGVGTVFYVDNDGDTYGDAEVIACTQPPGTVRRGGDCADSNRDVNPGAPERCSTAYDDNCDTVVNESTAIDATLWYWDTDEDGQGAETPVVIPPFVVTSCTQPPDLCIGIGFICFETIRYAGNDNDCDDSTARARVGGGPEVLDGYDNDCNGTRDDGLCSPKTTYYRDRDHDGWYDGSIQACTRPVEDPAADWPTSASCCDSDDDDALTH